MDSIQIRTGTAADRDAVREVAAKAFPKNDPDHMLASHPIVGERSFWRVQVADGGRIIGAVHVRRDQVPVGKALVVKGDVGAVSTLPEYQGKGHGTRLMQDTVAWMRDNDYDLSRLGGYGTFYSRFGYLRFPRRYYEIRLGDTATIGAATIEEGRIPIDAEAVTHMRPYNPATDGMALTALRRSFNAGLNGFVPPAPDSIFRPAADAWHAVYEENGTIRAYVLGQQLPKEVSEFEARVVLSECGCAPGAEEPLARVLEFVCNQAWAKQFTRITARFPFIPALSGVLARTRIRFSMVETYGGLASNMLQIVNLRSLMTRLAPELEARLADSGLTPPVCTFDLAIAKERVRLTVADAKIAVGPSEGTADAVVIDEFVLLQLVLGMLSFTEVEDRVPAPPAVARLLRVLFPRTAVVSGVWG
ncbi:MAG: hypothetical protein A3K19_25445 [Lentisphaerae bacterium RIFOXYB12_FULL_65_16]|nr:MAG: hypothetical protein A3K18_15310 [Lentisphaerae bacterium RIFOXYA12_64_32]OGV84878.1 MAG: hypothetical protein A3K19_25445 [Lentisphaerae bacterium RIFOXYB12_FULL_65_16]